MMDLHQSIQNILSKFHEFALIISQPEPPNPCSMLPSGHPPPPQSSFIKVNTDAALSSSHSSLAIIAKDPHGIVLKVWTRSAPKLLPLQAEAMALRWVVQLATRERWSHV